MATALYHVNPATGDAGPCRAKVGGCPFGDAKAHFFSKEAAQASWSEKEAKKSTAVKTWKKKPVKGPAPASGSPARKSRAAASDSYGGHGGPAPSYGGHGGRGR